MSITKVFYHIMRILSSTECQIRRIFELFINKTADGRNNLCGKNVCRIRKSMKLSQRQLAERLQLVGIDVDKNAIQRIECGKRFVTDIELIALSDVLRIPLEELLSVEKNSEQKPIDE